MGRSHTTPHPDREFFFLGQAGLGISHEQAVMFTAQYYRRLMGFWALRWREASANVSDPQDSLAADMALAIAQHYRDSSQRLLSDLAEQMRREVVLSYGPIPSTVGKRGLASFYPREVILSPLNDE